MQTPIMSVICKFFGIPIVYSPRFCVPRSSASIRVAHCRDQSFKLWARCPLKLSLYRRELLLGGIEDILANRRRVGELKYRDDNNFGTNLSYSLHASQSEWLALLLLYTTT